MQTVQLQLTPEQYHSPVLLAAKAAEVLGLEPDDIAHVQVVRRSLDSRRAIKYHVNVQVYLTGENYTPPDYRSTYRDTTNSTPLVIVGAGPAGLFAALRALELGIKPIIVERGNTVEQRRKDITAMVRSATVNPDSNWCFGEGGAGTYSDGKLYTRSTKRGNINLILNKFVEHGADPSILIDAHAHIGTDRLSSIIANIRNTIIAHGGQFHFQQHVDNLIIDSITHHIKGVHCTSGLSFEGCAVILATGHSARDIYYLFHRNGWLLQSKPFAIGVRVEHPQQLINDIQYHGHNHSPLLPPAAYSLTTQVGSHGVFSFCMCPGGIIVPAATADGEQVVNGMSNASRSSAFANSGIAVTVAPSDVPQYEQYGALALLRFQQDVEQRTAAVAGGGLKAPCQRLTDFCEGKGASRINRTNYMGTCVPSNFDDILPSFVSSALKKAFRHFGRTMHGFLTSQASILAVESRTSSPVRIPRDDTGQHPQLPGLYPCGEGAGYAGGIVSSAIDGTIQVERIANNIYRN